MVSIHPTRVCPVDLTQEQPELILTQFGQEYIESRLGRELPALAHCQRVESLTAQMSLVAHGNGVGVISATMLSALGSPLVRGPVTPAVRVELSLVARDLASLSPAAQYLLDVIREVFPGS